MQKHCMFQCQVAFLLKAYTFVGAIFNSVAYFIINVVFLVGLYFNRADLQ